MRVVLRQATECDMSFAFEAKRRALGPFIKSRWGWDEEFQLDLHKQRWGEKPQFIVLNENTLIGTVSIQEGLDCIRFGEFYLLPEYQGKRLGSEILASVLQRADEAALPVKLEYLKWNPVASRYQRYGFEITSETDVHFLAVRKPVTLTSGCGDRSTHSSNHRKN